VIVAGIAAIATVAAVVASTARIDMTVRVVTRAPKAVAKAVVMAIAKLAVTATVIGIGRATTVAGVRVVGVRAVRASPAMRRAVRSHAMATHAARTCDRRVTVTGIVIDPAGRVRADASAKRAHRALKK
jgi:hypothetical protein